MRYEIYKINPTNPLMMKYNKEFVISDDPKIVIYPKGSAPEINLDKSNRIKEDMRLYVYCLANYIITGTNIESIFDALKKIGLKNSSIEYVASYCDEEKIFLDKI